MEMHPPKNKPSHQANNEHTMETGNCNTAAPPPGGGVHRKQQDKYRYEVCFDNIVDQEDEYTVAISTELNGRTVTQMIEKFPMGQPE